MAEVVMLRTPNAPMTKSNRIVALYLLIFFVTIAMNIVIAWVSHSPIILIVTALFWINDLIVFTTVWKS